MRGLIHAGAHIGTEYLHERDRPLLLFEPQKAVFERLHRNLGGKPNVTLVNAALGAWHYWTGLNHCVNHDQSSSMRAPKGVHNIFPDYRFEGTETVQVITLDSYMASLNGSRSLYDELVIDVEGYELDVLRGAIRTLPQIRRIRCEVTTVEMYEGAALMDDIDFFLGEHGFEARETELHGPERAWGDTIYEPSNRLGPDPDAGYVGTFATGHGDHTIGNFRVG